MTDYDKLYRKDAKVCGEPFAEFVQFFERHAGPALSVLDLGCGQGRDALMAARKGHAVVGVDLSPTGVAQLCEAARVEGLAVTGVAADILAWRADRQFDVVILDRTLHMLAKPDDRLRVLAAAAQALRPGGHLLIADEPSNKKQLQGFFAAQGGRWQFTLDNRNFTFARLG